MERQDLSFFIPLVVDLDRPSLKEQEEEEDIACFCELRPQEVDNLLRI